MKEEPGFEWTALLKSVGSFVGIFFGSFVLGCVMGLITALLMKFSKLRDYPLLETSMFIIMSYSTFLFAEFAQLTGRYEVRVRLATCTCKAVLRVLPP